MNFTDPVQTSSHARAPGSSGIVGWAAYLACSWTWCIGMFLPALLVRDYGLWGFIVFAAPNVIGAAAMGWVLSRPGASERIVRAHGAACLGFSSITLAFHAFWLTWLTGSRTPDIGLGEHGFRYVLAAALVVGAITGSLATLAKPWLGAVSQWLLSIAAATIFIIALRSPGVDPASSLGPTGWARGLFVDADLVWLAPVCMFGFALCPYLDLTFHRARQSADARSARAAFSLGFGALFLSMIAFTLLYSGVLTAGRALSAFSMASAAVLAHIGSQTGFTVIAHARQAAATAGPRARRWAVPTVLVMLGASIIGAVAAGHPPGGALGPLWQHAGLTTGEILYRGFLSFYGLLFPAYVWLCMIPARGEQHTRPPTRRKLAVLAIACACAVPFYWMGFIERESIWLVPGLGVVLLSRLAIRAASPATRGSGGGEPA